MTGAEIIELGERRKRFARFHVQLALACLVLLTLLSLAMYAPGLSEGAVASDLSLVGPWSLSFGAVLTTQAHLRTERQPIRYSTGPLVVRSRPGRLATLLAGTVLFPLGLGLIASALVERFEGGLMLGLMAAIGLGMIGAIVMVWEIAAPALRGGPILVVSDEGVFAPAVMHRPVAWDDIASVPVAPSGTSIVLGLKVRKGAENYRSFWSRPLTKIASHVIYVRAADAVQADILLAIAHYRPALIEALTLPEVSGFRSAFSPARTI